MSHVPLSESGFGGSMNISVIIPVYNGAETIGALVQRLDRVLAKAAEAYEVILVNDGSRDGSWESIEALARQYPWARGIDLMRNSGQHNALLCGLRAARFEVSVTMDDDLQHPPEEMPCLLEKLAEGYDVVYGIPRKRPHSWWRNLGSIMTKIVVAAVIGTKTVRDVGPFRAFRTHLRQAFENYDNPDVMIDALLSWGATRFASVLVEEQPRTIGASNYSPGKLFRMSLLYLTNFSTMPLRIASFVGFFFTLMGLVGFGYVVGIYFTAGSVPGFPFLASAIMIFSGAQLFALGILGEYLARIFERTATRPPYVVARTVP
jgi:undecaprenyl-phosphate 4-deoxy-4-formamido-L-arabinose transferase